MLVLTRKIGEEIIIGDCIRVTITAIRGNTVRVGITAPPDVRVDREEIARRVGSSANPNRLFIPGEAEADLPMLYAYPA